MGKVVIGVSGCGYAIQTQDDTTGRAYEPIVLLPDVRKVKVSWKGSLEPVDADNVTVEQLFMMGPVDIEIERRYLSQAQEAALGGHTVVGGVLKKNVDDTPPDIGIVFVAKKDSGYSKYFRFYKGKFMPPDEDLETEQRSGGKRIPKFPTLKGTFIACIYDGAISDSMDSEDPDYNSATAAAWLTSMAAADSTPPTLSSVTPTDEDDDVAVGATVVWVFSEAILPSCVTAQNFALFEDGGTPVAGALSQSSDKKTITLTPASNLTAATKYKALANTGVKDLAGNALAAASLTEFTTAS